MRGGDLTIEADNTYCVYMHKNKINGKGYIGITGASPERRWKNGYGYFKNEHFYRAIQKYGWDNFEHTILHDGLSKEEAAKIEIDLIKKYNLTDPNLGYNYSRGGDLAKSKYIYQYDPVTGDFIKEWENGKVAAAAIGVVDEGIYAVCTGKTKHAKGNYYTYVDYGDHLPDNILEYINSDGNWKEVAQYDLNGNFLKKYKSIGDAEKSIGSKISFSAFVSGGYIWRKLEDLDRDYTLPLPEDEVLNAIVNGNSEEVYQYDLNGHFLRSWPGGRFAADKLGFSSSSLIGCCNGVFKTSGGFIWRHAKDKEYGKDLEYDEIKNINIKSNSFGISQYSKDGKFICWYPSIGEAATKTNTSPSSIRNAALQLRGYQSAGGFKWKLDEDALQKYLDKPKQQKARKIARCDMDGNVLQIYSSFKDVTKTDGHHHYGVSECCNGKRESYHGFKWKYAD